MRKLNPGIPPKDNNMYLLDIDFPFLVMAIWNAHEKQWSWANVQVNMIDGKYCDPYWETEYAEDDEIQGWCEL